MKACLTTKPMYCSREYIKTSRLIQQYEKSTSKQEVLQEHLGKHYHFELADDVCSQYNRFMNLMRKEEENSEGEFPWLEDTNERKYMTERF